MLSKRKRQDPRVTRTRHYLMQSLCDLMGEKEFDQITVQQITERAIINRATFYAHFDDKYKLLENMVQHSFHEMLDSKIDRNDGFTRENLRLLTLVTCEFLVEFHNEHTPGQEYELLPVEREVRSLVSKSISECVGHATLAQPGVSAEALAIWTSSIIFGSAIQWLHSRSKLSAEEMTDQIMFLMMSGLEASLA
jgi:AcrR family transcriptional regulator